jgi:hypothetical protein
MAAELPTSIRKSIHLDAHYGAVLVLYKRDYGAMGPETDTASYSCACEARVERFPRHPSPDDTMSARRGSGHRRVSGVGLVPGKIKVNTFAGMAGLDRTEARIESQPFLQQPLEIRVALLAKTPQGARRYDVGELQ